MTGKLVVSNNSAGLIVLSGDIELISLNRRAHRLLRDNSNYEVTDSSYVFSEGSDFNKTLSRIKAVAKIIDCEVVFSEDINSEINEYLVEEKKFEVFSQKALSIRENHCDLHDFLDFKRSLEKNMVNRTLYELQMLSAYHLAFSQNGCNFSVPGAGKTSVVYGAYAYLKNLPDNHVKKIDRLLIIGPLSSFGPWESEYEACFGRVANSKRLVGSVSVDEKKQYLYDFAPAELTLLSYASVPSLIEELNHYLGASRVMVVLDEAHKIKNTSGGVLAEAVMKLSEKAKARVILTGTPAPNGYEDLANLFKFIWPTKQIIKFQTGQLKDMSKNMHDPRVGMLLESLKPYFIRVRKQDLNIPPAISHPAIIVPMHESQRMIYDAIERKYMAEIAENKDDRFRRALVKARLIRLMQAATNPSLLLLPLETFALEEGIDLKAVSEDSALIREIMHYGSNDTPAKFEVALTLINKIISSGEKVVVWACYIKTIELFKDYLQKNGIPCRLLYGATPVATDGMTELDEDYELTREAIIKEFNSNDSNFKVVIANPFAVAESISLHKACHNAIYIERSFNCAHFIQSKDRIHRYGLPEGTVTNYYYLVSENSVDGVIDERLAEKEARLLDIIESMPIPLFDNASVDGGDEDIKAVLQDYVRRAKAL